MPKPPRWAGNVVAQHLPSMRWVLASNPITTNTQSCQAMALGYGSSNGLTCTDLRRCALGIHTTGDKGFFSSGKSWNSPYG